MRTIACEQMGTAATHPGLKRPVGRLWTSPLRHASDVPDVPLHGVPYAAGQHIPADTSPTFWDSHNQSVLVASQEPECPIGHQGVGGP
jgi:hypothetical protein